MSGKWRSSGLLLLVVGWAPAAMLLVAVSAPAEAACTSGSDYGSIANVEGGTATATSNGTRSTVWVGSGPTNCQRISSVYVQDAPAGIELGWVLGYSTCTGLTYTQPTMFWGYRTSSGAANCGVWSARKPSTNQFHVLEVSDTNKNTVWGMYLDGTSLAGSGINLDFAQGISFTGMERGSSADSGDARWYELNEYHQGNGWTRWDSPYGSDHDPQWNWRRINAFTVVTQRP